MIQAEKEYDAIVERVEALLLYPDNIENQEAKGYIGQNILSDILVDYEETTLSDILQQ